MTPIAALPMYDWTECRAETDERWEKLAGSLRRHGIHAPAMLTRQDNLADLWLDDHLLLAQTCAHPLATSLKGRVRYVATPVDDALGCGEKGTYRSAIIRKGGRPDAPVPPDDAFDIPQLGGRMAANMPDSLSGYVALVRDAASAGIRPCSERDVLWTGSHRASVVAVANGLVDYAAIDCVTFALARRFEPAANQVHVAGWTAARPALPLITRRSATPDEIATLRRAVLEAIPAVVLTNPTDDTGWTGD